VNDPIDSAGRRELLVGAGAALLASTAVDAHAAGPRPLTQSEMANLKLFREFQDSFDSPTVDIDEVLTRYLAPDASVRWFDDEPRQEGREAAAKVAKAGWVKGMHVHARIIGLFAHGPMVASSRVDTIKRPGKPDEILKIAGVCIIKGGRIQEYCDYIIA
jgi:limonene-1,2-epoxide hydrolase